MDQEDQEICERSHHDMDMMRSSGGLTREETQKENVEHSGGCVSVEHLLIVGDKSLVNYTDWNNWSIHRLESIGI